MKPRLFKYSWYRQITIKAATGQTQSQSLLIRPRTIMFFTRLTSWESACKIIGQRWKISPLYLFPLFSSLSLFLPSLRNKSKTRVFPAHLKTILEVVLSELKIWDVHYYVQERMLFLQKHSLSLKLQNLFRAHVIFQFTH